jgi:hypothetical protein
MSPGRTSLDLTEQMDLYLGVVVTLMFLSGCIVMVLSVREQLERRRRERSWVSARPRQPAESKPL